LIGLVAAILALSVGAASATECDPERWSEPERVVWRAALAGEAPPDAPGDVTALAQAALVCPELSGALPAPGLRLRGARIGALALSARDVGLRFACEGCEIAGFKAPQARFAKGLTLDGSRIGGALDLRATEFGDALSLRDVRIVGDGPVAAQLDDLRAARSVDLGGALMRGALSLSRARIAEDLRSAGVGATGIDLADASVGGAVDLSHSGVAGPIRFGGARVGGDLSLLRAQAAGPVEGERASIGGALRADALTAPEVRLEGLSAGGLVVFSGAVVDGPLDLDSARIGGSLWIRTYEGAPAPVIAAGGAPVALSMNNAAVGGRIDAAGARFGGKVSLDAARIGEDLWLRHGSAVEGELVAVFSRIGQNVDLSGSTLGDVDLTGAAIGGELRMGAPGPSPDGAPRPLEKGLAAPTWRDGAHLWLRNAQAAAIVDTGRICAAIDDWPPSLDISGFAYARIGGLGGGDERARAGCGFHVDWLARQQPFSLDPYRRLANLLDDAGEAAAARAVRWAGKDRQLSHAEGLEWVRLALQKAFVGYGIYTYAVFVWMIALALFGALIFPRAPEARTAPVPLGLLFSVDVLLPFVSFRPAHDQIDFKSPYRFYLYFHKFMGWVFALFFVSGLSGLFAV
jgi:hypothetical protein